MKYILIALVRAYQLMISPYFPTSCRYYPSCSQYAIDALKVHGFFKGTALAAWRVLRCHPWAEGGEDLVPEKHHCTVFSKK
ncbi:MAG: membrane protein insertion efficiency factor YidD [Balneolales bacterium]